MGTLPVHMLRQHDPTTLCSQQDSCKPKHLGHIGHREGQMGETGRGTFRECLSEVRMDRHGR